MIFAWAVAHPADAAEPGEILTLARALGRRKAQVVGQEKRLVKPKLGVYKENRNFGAQEKHATMREQYNQTIAFHYSSYRPPLHALILGRVLSEEAFSQGLDLGCGTGYSAVALAKYCTHVYGIDPSQSMLKEARTHENITYLQGTGENLPLPDKSVDVVTFAGSLFYAKSTMLIEELKRVCRKQALVVPYDFEVLIADTLLQFGIKPEKIESAYNYEINFSESADFIELIRKKEQVEFEVTATELAHILLSSLQSYEIFIEKYGIANPFPALLRELEGIKEQHNLRANIYFSKYKLNISNG